MPGPSTIDRLPEEVRVEIGRLRQNGRTLDEILAHLKTMDGIAPVSRSALGRHVKGLAKAGERARRGLQIAEALVGAVGDGKESQLARAGIQMVHTAVLDLFMQEDDGEGPALGGDTKNIKNAAGALADLARASKINMDFIAAAEKRATEMARQEAVDQVETIGREKGISADTLNAIKAGIFGVRPP